MREYWFDAEGKPHLIKDMDEDYILNCLKNLEKWLKNWEEVLPTELNEYEMKQKDKVGMKAWFVFNGIDYINTFCDELDRRK